MKNSFYQVVFILAVISLSCYAKNSLSFDENLTSKVGNSNQFVIDIGAGSLIVRGEDVQEISVTAHINSEKYKNIEDLHEAFAEKMVFNLQSKGSKMILTAKNKDKLFSMSHPNIAIDLEVIMPKNMNLSVDDGSGSMEIVNINGSLDIDDGSGSTLISHIYGDVRIDDGSGHININDVKGSINIDDGSGSIDIVGVTGDVTVDDGSGSINIDQMAGNFKLIDDGSGSVFVNGSRWVKK